MRYPEYLQAVRLNLNLEIPRFAFVRKQEVAISVFTLSIRTFPCRVTLRHRGIAAAVLACLMAAPSQLQAADVTQPVTSADIGDKMSLTLAQLSRDFGVQGTIPARQFHQRIATTAQAHPSLLSAVEQNETARAFVRESYSAWLPQISTSVDGRITRTDTLGDYQLAETQHNSDYNVTLRQMVFDFGAAAAGVSSARARSRGAAERLSTKEAEVALQAITAYLEVLKSRQLMALAVDNDESRQAIVAMVRERYELGGGSRADITRAEARLTDAQAGRVAAEVALRSAEAGYLEMFGELPGLTPMPTDAPLEALDWTADTLAERFGGLREARENLDASRADARLARARLLPTLNLELSAGRRDQDLVGTPYTEKSAHLTIRYNLYSGGADLARRSQAVHRARQAEQDTEALERQVVRAIDQSLAQVRNADRLVKARRAAVQGASDSLLAVKEQFAYRRGSLLDLLRSQEELYVSGNQFISEIIERSRSRYRFLFLTAGLEPLLNIATPGSATGENP